MLSHPKHTHTHTHTHPERLEKGGWERREMDTESTCGTVLYGRDTVDADGLDAVD